MDFSPSTQKIIKEKISTYAAGVKRLNLRELKFDKIGGNPFEVVAEHVTKEITKPGVLDPNTMLPVKNPFAALGQEDGKLQDILKMAWNGIIWR